jgi:hypothetical protein
VPGEAHAAHWAEDHVIDRLRRPRPKKIRDKAAQREPDDKT